MDKLHLIQSEVLQIYTYSYCPNVHCLQDSQAERSTTECRQELVGLR